MGPAVRISESRLNDPAILTAVLEVAGHPDIRVRLQVALSCPQASCLWGFFAASR